MTRKLTWASNPARVRTATRAFPCWTILQNVALTSTHLELSLPLHSGTFFATDSPPSSPPFHGPPEFFHHPCLTQVLIRALSSRLISLLDVFSLVSLPHSTTITTKYRPSLSPQPGVMLRAAHQCLQHKCTIHFVPLPSTPTCPPCISSLHCMALPLISSTKVNTVLTPLALHSAPWVHRIKR